MSEVDVIFVSGGNILHLLKWIKQSGFDNWLKNNLENKIYVGVSAGTIIATPIIAIAGVEPGDENIHSLIDLTAMNLVDFEISSHTPCMLRYEANEAYAKNIKNVLYAIDDQTAIEVVDDNFRIIPEGVFKVISKK